MCWLGSRHILQPLARVGVLERTAWAFASTGPLWAITPKGYARLREVGRLPSIRTVPDLQLPTTPVATAEWQARLQLARLIVRLITTARTIPFCADFRVLVLGVPPTATTLLPDAALTIRWQPPTRQAESWLPWLSPPLPSAGTVQSPVYVERVAQPDATSRLLDIWRTTPPVGLPLLILPTEVRRDAVLALLRSWRTRPALRISSWAALSGPVDGTVWWDAEGQPLTLRPRLGEVIGEEPR